MPRGATRAAVPTAAWCDGRRQRQRPWRERLVPKAPAPNARALRTRARASLIRAALLGLALGGWATAGDATPLPGSPQGGIIEQEVTLSPRRPLLAHVRFCLLYDGQCDPRPDRRDPAMGVRDKFDQAMGVNRAVNRAIRPQADAGFDSWDIGVTAGDCEDYALEKRRSLKDLGWPTEHLRMAVVRTARGEPHAVLLVRIGDVDYVLDNLHDRVLPWHDTRHIFLMLQDRDDPRAWHDVAPRRGGGVGTS